MSPEVEFIRAEIPEIAKIVRDECWLEGERRGTPVDPKDPAIRQRVAEIILSGAGAMLRQKCQGNGATKDSAAIKERALHAPTARK